MEPVRKVSGAIQVLDRADVDTDQIVPKQFLKRIERSGFGEYLFYDWRREGLDIEPGPPILVTGRNFGCGSSREPAAWPWRTSATRRSWRQASPTSSTRTARRSACCPSCCPKR